MRLKFIRKMGWTALLCAVLSGCGTPAPVSIDQQREAHTADVMTYEQLSLGRQAYLEQYRTAIASAQAIQREKMRLEAYKDVLYVMEGGKSLYTSEAMDHLLKTLPAKTLLFQESQIKDTTGALIGYGVKEQWDAKEMAGYIRKGDVLTNPSEGMVKSYPDADYLPFEKPNFRDNPKIKVRGIYVSAHTAASGERFWKLVDEARAAGVNALVIDIKDDNEAHLFPSETAAKYSGVSTGMIKDPAAFTAKLKEKDIYLIGRIVTFKSPAYARAHLDRAIVNKDTGKLHSDSGMIWASPYDRELWAYNIGIAEEVARLGFNEVQFDYVRFPASNGGKLDAVLDYRNVHQESKTGAIQKFLLEAAKRLHPHQVYVAADVFGWTASEVSDVGIGQHWEAMTNVVDYMCPMIYPSHYGPGNYGLAVPDAKPYLTVYRSTQDALARDQKVMYPADMRPWIQDFTATWVRGHIRYTDREVQEQIRALRDLGIDEYILWNAGNRYHFGALKDF